MNRESVPAVGWGKTTALALCGGLLAGLLACGAPKPPVVDFSAVNRQYGSGDYRGVYARWTRHQKVIHRAESALEVWATFKSRDYREAFAAHYATSYSMNLEDRANLVKTQREAAEADYEFLITAQSTNYRWNDLEKKNSPWRITLIDGAGHEIPPEKFKVEKLPDMFEREFFL